MVITRAFKVKITLSISAYFHCVKHRTVNWNTCVQKCNERSRFRSCRHFHMKQVFFFCIESSTSSSSRSRSGRECARAWPRLFLVCTKLHSNDSRRSVIKHTVRRGPSFTSYLIHTPLLELLGWWHTHCSCRPSDYQSGDYLNRSCLTKSEKWQKS